MTFEELKQLIYNGQDKFKDINFANDIWLNRFSLTGPGIPLDLVFENCFFKSIHIELTENDIVATVLFRNCHISSNVFILGVRKKRLTFSDCLFKSEVLEIKDCGPDFSFSLISTAIPIVRIHGCQDSEELIFRACNVKGLEINNSSFNKISIFDSNTSIEYLHISRISLKVLEIIYGFFGWLKVEDSEIENLELFGISRSKNDIGNSLRLKNIKGDNLKISEVSFNGLVQINLISFSNSKFLQNSVFAGNLEFKNQDLSGFMIYALDLFEAKLEFENSIIYDAHFFDIVWPKNFLLSYDYKSLDSYGKLDFKLRSLAAQYRQLKIMSSKNGDKISSLSFFAHEMEVNYILLKREKKDKLWDWLLLSTNKHFSGFGLSYIKPLIWLFGVHIVLFILFVLAGYNDMSFVWPWTNTFDGIGVSVGQYFYLLNPLRSLPDSTNGWVLVIDFFSRLINSYFIYYFLKATRKFSL